MNPYAANFQVPVPNAAPTATVTGAAAVVGLEGGEHSNDQEQAAAWAEDPSQSIDGAGGYWDEHGHHHPGYDSAVYHPDGYDPAYHQVCRLVLPPRQTMLFAVFFLQPRCMHLPSTYAAAIYARLQCRQFRPTCVACSVCCCFGTANFSCCYVRHFPTGARQHGIGACSRALQHAFVVASHAQN